MKAILQSNLSRTVVKDGVISGVKLMEVNRTARFKGADGKVKSIEITPELISGLLAHAGNRSIPSHLSHDHFRSEKDSIHARLGSVKNITVDAAGNMIGDIHVMPNEAGKVAIWMAENDPDNAAMSAIFEYNPITRDGKTYANPLSFDTVDLVAEGAACSALFSGDGDGEWKTISGRKIFIKKGQSLDDAMKEGGVEKTSTDYNKDNIDVSDDVPEGHTLHQDGALWIVKKDGKMVSAAASRSGAIDQAKNPPKSKSSSKRKTSHDKAIDNLQSKVNSAKFSFAELTAVMAAFNQEETMTKEEIESLFDERIQAALSNHKPVTKEQIGEQITAALSTFNPKLSDEDGKKIALLAKADLVEQVGQVGLVATFGAGKQETDELEKAITAQLSAGAKDRTVAIMRLAKDKPELYNKAVESGKL